MHIGGSAVVEVTGLRNPCYQLDGLQEGLMKATLDRDAQGNLIRKAGVMGIVIVGGDVVAGDAVRVVLPTGTRDALKPV